MNNTINENINTIDREIVITRVLNAPRDLVFEVWTDPKHIIKWWGPKGFTNTIDEMEVKSGGIWKFVMHGPDGVDYKNEIVYKEVVKPELLVYSHGGDEGEVNFNVRVTFEEQGEKTRLTMRTIFASAEERNKVIKEYGAIEGGNSTMDCLEEYLEEVL